MRRLLLLLLLLAITRLSTARIKKITYEFRMWLKEYALLDHLESFQETGVIHALEKRMKTHGEPQNSDFTPPKIKRLNSHIGDGDTADPLIGNRENLDPLHIATSHEIKEWWALTDKIPEESDEDDDEVDTDLSVVVEHFRRATRKFYNIEHPLLSMEMDMKSLLTTRHPVFGGPDDDSMHFHHYLHNNHWDHLTINDFTHMAISDQTANQLGDTFKKTARNIIRQREKSVNTEEEIDAFLIGLLTRDAQKDANADEHLSYVYGLILGEIAHIFEEHHEHSGEL